MGGVDLARAQRRAREVVVQGGKKDTQATGGAIVKRSAGHGCGAPLKTVRRTPTLRAEWQRVAALRASNRA